MPRVNARQSIHPVVVFEEVFVSSVSVSKNDVGNSEPAYFYVNGMVNGEETQFTVSGLPAAEFQKWCNLPPVPFKLQAELHFGQFSGQDGTRVNIRLHVPQILGIADSVANLVQSNGKRQSQS